MFLIVVRNFGKMRGYIIVFLIIKKRLFDLCYKLKLINYFGKVRYIILENIGCYSMFLKYLRLLSNYVFNV